jgi:hypothetical protein
MANGEFISDALEAIPFVLGQRDLIVLRVVLEPNEDPLKLVLDLIVYGKVTDEGKRTWRLTLQDLGISETGWPESSTHFVLPPQVQEGLRASLALMNLESERPLWLNLVRPYGYIGMLPWEFVLGTLLDRPVLRLPDFLERPRENTSVLELAVVFDPPSPVPAAQAELQLRSIVEQTLAASSRPKTSVNVFTTAAWIEQLEQLRSIGGDPRVKIHSPHKAVELVESLHSRPERRTGARPWLDWICAAVEGRSIDAVHFVGRAVVTSARSGLLISSAPVPDPDNQTTTVSLITIADIGVALTRVGAWAAIFSPPPDSCDGLAMPFVADAFAHSRPGTVLYHRAKAEDREILRQSLQFLFSSEPAQPPKLSAGFVYCQPGIVAAHVDFQDKLLFDVLKQNADLIGTPDTPNWAAATQRYIESVTLDQLRRNSPDVLFTKMLTGAVVASEQDKALKETLSDIQKIVGCYVQKYDKM